MEALRTPAPAASGARFGRLARSLPDGRLVARVRLGDEAAFEALFDRYHRQLLAFCRHMLGTREEAEDALQHVFVAAHRHLVSGDDRVLELRPWLYAIARNRCLSVLRARREAVALDDVPEPSGDGLEVGDEVAQREDLQEVLADMARLPDDQRAALVLSELGALSHDEVAEVLGVRREKVKALVFQARESLAGWRQARTTDCGEIREQLANLRGAALRRGPLRKHLDTCEGCRAFRTEVRRQREVMALVLPVVPGIALKAKVLGAVAAGGHLLPGAAVTAGTATGLAAGAGVGATGQAAATGGGIAALGGGIAGKALIVAAIAGTAGGGYAVVRESSVPPAVEPTTRVVKPASGAPLPALPTSVPTPPSVTHGAAVSGATGKAKGHAGPKGEAQPGNGSSSKAKDGARGRPAVPGANGLEHAPKAQGPAHRRSDPPARGTHGIAPGASAGRGAGKRTARRGGRPAHPVKPVVPSSAPVEGQGATGTSPDDSGTDPLPADDTVVGVVEGTRGRSASALHAARHAAGQ